MKGKKYLQKLKSNNCCNSSKREGKLHRTNRNRYGTKCVNWGFMEETTGV